MCTDDQRDCTTWAFIWPALVWCASIVASIATASPAPTMPAIIPAGVLGNSGETGSDLVRVAAHSRSLACGAAVDSDLTLWVSASNGINRLALDGHLIEHFPLAPPGSLVDSRTFAVVADRLCFLGRLSSDETRLFALKMHGPDGRTATPLPVALPLRRRDYVPYVLSPEPLDGRLVLAAEPKDLDGQIGIYFIDPENPPSDLRPALVLPGEYPGGIAVDSQQRIIYLGASFGLFVGGETHGTLYGIHAVTPEGRPASPEFPVACTKTPAIPTQFRGIISLAGGALWDTAWYGFLSRLDLQGRGAPGRVVQWHHELGYPTQVVGIAAEPTAQSQLLYLTTSGPEAGYLAHWDAEKATVAWVRRVGCLPTIVSLGICQDGFVTVGTSRTQLWWPWEAGPDAPPAKAELHIAVTPVYWDRDRCFALAAQYGLEDLEKRNPVGAIFSARVGDRNEARRVTDPVPFKRPIGLSVACRPGEMSGTVYVTDAETRQLFHTSMWLPELKPDNAKWEAVRLTDMSLSHPTDVVALTDGRLLLADGPRILLLEPRDGTFVPTRAFSTWGEGPRSRFGATIRFAVRGPWMIVSDTERHRVVWLDWTSWTVLGQFGQTDAPGADRAHLHTPTLVALAGSKAVVADTGNQRVVKLELQP